MLKNINDVELDSGKVVLKFSAEWCNPCKQFQPTFEKVAESVDVPFIEVDIDVDGSTELVQKYGVRTVPMVVLLEDGAVARTNAGNTTEERFRAFIG